MVAPLDSDAGARTVTSMDQWGGYPAARERLVRAIAERAPQRTVVLTGDIHANYVNEVRAAGSPASVAAELVGTSISSGGDGAERWTRDDVLAANPQLRWHNARRGYVTCHVTADAWDAEFRTVPYVTRPDAPIETASRWRVTHGRTGIERT
jgi:alkaline phosphatase D